MGLPCSVQKRKLVHGASVARAVGAGDPDLLKPFIEGAKELIAQGVKAITTSCGFLVIFQREMADALPVPVFTYVRVVDGPNGLFNIAEGQQGRHNDLQRLSVDGAAYQRCRY